MRAAGAERPEDEPAKVDSETETWGVDPVEWDAAGAWAREEEPAAPGPATGSFGVWPENWPTVLLFWRVRRCWRSAPMGGLLGLDWPQVQAKAHLAGLRSRRRLAREMARLEAMEDAVLEELSGE